MSREQGGPAVLAARISSGVLQILDETNSAYWSMSGPESDILQVKLEHRIRFLTSRWVREQEGDGTWRRARRAHQNEMEREFDC